MNNKYKTFKKNLFRKDINKRMLFDYLKIDYSFKEQEYVINRLPKTFESLIYGKPIFHSINDFGKKMLSYYNSEQTELGWLIHLFKRYSVEINRFLKLKIEYENNLLIGEYQRSNSYLTEIKNITFSYWGLENKFLQTQYEKGLEFNFRLLNKSKNQKISDPAFFFLVHFFSNKVEEDISYFSYINALENFLNNDIPNDYKEYFQYRLNSISYDYKNIDSILRHTSNLSLIDKYIHFKDIVAHIVSGVDLNEKYPYMKEYCDYISYYIDDSFLQKVNLLTKNTDIINGEFNNYEISLLDLFTKGNYQEVINNSKEVLSKNVSFNILEIYAKSHIHLQKNIEDVNSKKCLLNTIISLIYKILRRNNDSNDAIVDLLTLANALSSFGISKEIVTFLRYHISKEVDIENYKVAFLFSKYYNPIHYSIFNDIADQRSYLDNISVKNSQTVDLFKNTISESTISQNIDIKQIPEHRITFYLANNYFQKGWFKECKIEIEKIFTEIEKITYLKEQCVKLLFNSFVELGEYDNAIDLYTDNYISNLNLVSKIDAKKLSQKIIQKKWKCIKHSNINFSIFMFLAHDDTHPKYIAYDLFMRSLKISLPSELNSIDNIDLKKKIFFLRNVANPKIISRKAIVFKNSNAVLKERISICQILSKIDSSSIYEYSKEISDITQRLTVQQRIKEIDESKIYIDENGILDKELSEVQKGFNRFKNISQLLKESNIDATGIGYDALYNLLKGKIDAETYKKSLRKTDIHFELFTQLFLEIRDKFLFSNQYGLDYYLSQRIRHGTIIGQIRKSFKAHNLVTTKSSKNEEYLPNKYWSINKLNLDKTKRGLFEARMSIFSSKIDAIISNLKNKYIQIRTEDPKTKQTGWFDYMYIPRWSETSLYNLFVKKLQFITDFEEFARSMFEVLWNMTENNLLFVREKINTEIKSELIGELDLLEVDLKMIIPNKSTTSLYRAIADCRTNVQADIDYAVRWFNKSKNDEIDFSIEDALNTSIQIVKNIISPNILEIQSINNSANDLLKGLYFTHFVDLMRIFITNIYDYYSKAEITDKASSILIFQKGDILTLNFTNNLAGDEDIEKLKSKINIIKLELEQTNVKGIRGEGNTGFSKANNILKNVFRNSNILIFKVSKEKFVVKCEILLNNIAV